MLSTVSREETRVVSDSSAARRAAPTMRSHRPAVGGSMLSSRQRASSSTRTCSGLDPPQLVAVRRAIMPPLFALPPEPSAVERLSLPLLRREISDGWTLYHDAEFGRLMDALPGIISDARFVAVFPRSWQ
jgi:hypothetical protein